MTDTARPPMLAGPEDLDLGQLDDLAASSTDAAAAGAEAAESETAPAPETAPEATPAPRTLGVIVEDIKRKLGALQGINEYMADVEVVADVERLLEDVVMVFETFVAALNETSSQATATVADLNEQLDAAIAAFGEEGRKRVEAEQATAAREGDLGAARIALAAQHSECEVLRDSIAAATAVLEDHRRLIDRQASAFKDEQSRALSAERKLLALPSWGMWQIEWMKGGKRTRTLVLAPDMAGAIRVVEGEGVAIVGVKAQEQHGVSFKIADAATV